MIDISSNLAALARAVFLPLGSSHEVILAWSVRFQHAGIAGIAGDAGFPTA